MANTVKKVLHEEYSRLKKAFDKLIRPKKVKTAPQLVLQPIRTKNI